MKGNCKSKSNEIKIYFKKNYEKAAEIRDMIFVADQMVL